MVDGEKDEVAADEVDDIRADLAAVAEAPAAPEPATEAAPEAPEKADDGRDEKGRFLPKEKPAETAEGIKPTPAPAGAPAVSAKAATQPAPVPTEKPAEVLAPRTWKPIGREVWAKVPPEAQKEIIRREHETTQALQNAAEHRRQAETWQQTLAPFEQVFRREGVDAVRGVASLLPAVQALQEGTPQRKAEVAAQIIKAYGVDIAALDQVLSGQQAPQQAQQLDPNTIIARAKAELAAELQQRQQAAAVERESAAVEQFSTKAEFLDDVRDDMADLLESSARRGLALTLEEAYDRACYMNPEIRRVMQQREAAANVSTTSTQRARAASSSVRSQPAGARLSAPSSGSIEDDIREAAASLASR